MWTRFTHSVAAKISAAILLVATALLAIDHGEHPRADDLADVNEVHSVFDETIPADAPTRLLLDSDHQKVVGWISGKADYAGRDATIHVGTQQIDIVQIESGNTFEWDIKDRHSGRVEVRIGDELAETIHLVPRTQGGPFSYFVVDRSAYRPGQTIKFVGFLRSEASDGEFVSHVNREIDAVIVSADKNTKAAQLQLKSDEYGRVEGEYTFSKADALGEYHLRINGYLGVAKFQLAEFRKAKVRLKIDSELEANDLKLKFQAVDFLDKGVPGTEVRFHAKVVYVGQQSNDGELLGKEFVYQTYSGFASWFGFADASQDERLLHMYGSLATPSPQQSSPVAAELHGEVDVNEDGSAEHIISLNRSWTRGGYAVIVEAVLTDYNGREQRASRRISLAGEVTDCDLQLSLPKTFFEVGEPIRVSIKPGHEGEEKQINGAVIAMRLSPKRPTPNYDYFGDFGWGQYGHGYGRYHHLNYRSARYGGYRRIGRDARVSTMKIEEEFDPETCKRTLVDSQLIVENSADLVLEQPGAYQLVCMAVLPDGTKLKNEIGCVVKEPEEMPNLIVNLDQKEFRSDQPLTGWIHSLVENAEAMVTLRDSTGIRHRQKVQLENGMGRINFPIPAAMRYGATVEVEFPQNDRMYFSNNFVRIVPVDQMVDVKISSQELYSPGEEVVLDLQSNLAQEMDLVVSVIDQSLLGVAADKSVDIKNFFLADERVIWRRNSKDVKRYLDGLTVIQLIEDAEQSFQDGDLDEVARRRLTQATKNYRNNRYMTLYDLVLLLNQAGVDVGFSKASYGYNVSHQYHAKDQSEDERTVYDLLVRMRNAGGQGMDFEIRDDSLVIAAYDRYRNQHALFQPSWNQMGQGYGMRSARGDARFSVTANAVFSHGVSGQAMFSHAAPIPVVAATPSATSSISVRKNFADAAYWNAKVRTDKSGKAQVKFKLPDSLTNWQVVVTAITPTHQVGQSKKTFRTFKPIMIWPMLPRTFTEGDVVSIYGSVHNRSEKPQTIKVSLQVENGEILSETTKSVRIEPKANAPVYWQFKAEDEGFTDILMTATCRAGSDASLKKLPVQPMKATQWVTNSGFLRNGGTLNVPREVNLADAELEITIVPSLLSDIEDSLDYLVQYPHGCVEQTMSRFLPAIAVKEVFDHAGIENPELEAKLPSVVEAGIKRLLELQKPDGGWGWHGGSETHEMMTPYALYGLFRAEKSGYEIPNENAIQNGVNRLYQFIGNMRSVEQVSDRVYCMYVYSHRHECNQQWLDMIGAILDGKSAGGTAFKPEDRIEGVEYKLLQKAELSDYAIALALEIAVNNKAENLAERLAIELRKRASGSDDSAFWTTANFSRWGNDRFEITAAALKALVAYDSNDPMIAKALNFFASTKRGNRWNSTKDTAMILYGVCDYLKTQPFVKNGAGEVELVVGDWSKTVQFDSVEPTRISVPASQLLAGNNQFVFYGDAPGAMFRAVLKYHQRGEDITAAAKGVEVERKFFLLNSDGEKVRELLSGDSIAKGAYIQSVVTATHQVEERMQYVLVENPKPSTCEILPASDKRFAQASTRCELREDKTTGVNYHHQATGKQIVDRCILHVELSGTYWVPPAKVELMYNTLQRGHSEGFKLVVE